MPTYNARRGRFIVMSYTPSFGEVAVDMKVLFAPNPLAWTAQVALIQIVKCRAGADLGHLDEDFYKVGGGPDHGAVTWDGWHVDAKGRRCPVFGMTYNNLDGGGSPDAQWASVTGDMNGKELKGALGSTGSPATYALLHDRPGRATIRRGVVFKHEFEIVAITVTGKLKGYCLGALKWGYTCEDGHNAVTLPITVHPEPSEHWIEACGLWNKGYGGLAGSRLQVPKLI